MAALLQRLAAHDSTLQPYCSHIAVVPQLSTWALSSRFSRRSPCIAYCSHIAVIQRILQSHCSHIAPGHLLTYPPPVFPALHIATMLQRIAVILQPYCSDTAYIAVILQSYCTWSPYSRICRRPSLHCIVQRCCSVLLSYCSHIAVMQRILRSYCSHIAPGRNSP